MERTTTEEKLDNTCIISGPAAGAPWPGMEGIVSPLLF